MTSIATCLAERGFVLVQVQDARSRPIQGVNIGIDGFGASRLSGSDGKAKLAIGTAAKTGDWLTLSILQSPPGRHLVMVSPWDNRAQVPSFEDKPENFLRIVVVEQGDRVALENGTVVAALAAKINKANSAKTLTEPSVSDPKASLIDVAQQYGVTPEELDNAIRTLGKKTSDPYEAGLAALYERDYPKATTDLQSSLQQRDAKLSADKNKVREDEYQVADAAFFLGNSLYEQGHYSESAVAYRKCLQIRGDDSTVMGYLAVSLGHQAEYTEAESLMRKALAIDEKTFGLDHPELVAIDLSNLAALLYTKGDYVAAEPPLRRALAISEKSLGRDDPRLALILHNLGMVLVGKNDYADAEPLLRRALAILEKAGGPEVAPCLANLGDLLRTEYRYAEAEPLLRRALAIDEKVHGLDHPYVATDLNNLGLLLEEQGDYPGAEKLFRRAVDIDEKMLGPDHPSTKKYSHNLDVLLQA